MLSQSQNPVTSRQGNWKCKNADLVLCFWTHSWGILLFYRIAIFGVESVPITIVNCILYKNKTGGATETKGNGEQGVVIGQLEPKTKLKKGLLQKLWKDSHFCYANSL